MPPFPYCGRFAEPDGEQFTCMDDIDDAAGCGVNCRACTADANTPGHHGAWIYGRRWMRPSQWKDSRNAEGLFPFPYSGDVRASTRLYPRNGGNYEIALCWRQMGMGQNGPVQENFQHGNGENYSLCDCGTGSNECGLDDPTGMWLTDPLATCFVSYAGWPPGGPNIFQECTGKYTKDEPLRVRFSSAGILNAGIINMGSDEDRGGAHRCTTDYAAKCWGHRENDAYGCGTADPNAYYDSTGWPLFDYLQVFSFDASFGGTHPEDVMRNAFLSWLKDDMAQGFSGHTHLDQLDSARRNSGASANHNSGLGIFGRDWDTGEPQDQVLDIEFEHDSGRVPMVAVPAYIYTVDIGVPDTAISDVTITVTAKGLWSTAAHKVTVQINGNNAGEFFATALTDCTEYTESVTVSRNDWNAWVTTNEFTVGVFNAGTTASDCNGDTYSQTVIEFDGQNVFTGEIPYESIPHVATLTGITRKGRFAVTGEYIPLLIRIKQHLMLQTVRAKHPSGTPSPDDSVYALTTMEVTAVMGVRADTEAFNGQGHSLVETWKEPEDRPPSIPVRISNNRVFAINNMPSVDGGVDRIDWFHDGESVNPPTQIRWSGHSGYTSESGPQLLNGTSCDTIHTTLATLPVPSRASHIAGAEGRKRLVWTGSVLVGFPQ